MSRASTGRPPSAPVRAQGKNLTRALPSRGGTNCPITRQVGAVTAQTRTVTLMCDSKHTHR
ncbi:hypothetical protein SAM23877_5111 [Streptomyces ambofaciens ATCC 23877]|uniref:Uncharacterized protein n=1 Tax=Streptomyces ambofaciens (strain ATCC 23877 / 3486 / DSM 40053 / JCM 4204 / NBRC 12836 / NRRL B-2516) TaxID=278992 RepID=A0A0K2AZ26_STRA7|nr:hypothetical protein SAM23877_5111 [Streptomyces ambofaciens ATCC 23877]